MPIFVDNRGDGEARIAELLQQKNYPVVVQHIESGDYVFDEVGIERKTISDLCGSVQSKQKGHSLWEQLKVLKDTYKKPSLLIEGFIDWDDRTVSSIIIGVTNGFGIPYYNSVHKLQSAQIIGKVFERYGVARTSRIPPPAVKKGYTPKQVKWMMLQTVPHLGGVMATRLLEELPWLFSMETHKSHSINLGQLSLRLDKIKGLNKDSKEMLLRVFDYEDGRNTGSYKREGE